MIDFKLFKKTADTAASELKKISQLIEDKKQERDDLLTLPIPQDEFRERLRGFVNQQSKAYFDYASRPEGGFRKIYGDPFLDMETYNNVPILTLRATGATPQEVSPIALFAILKEPIMEGIDKLVEARYADNPIVGPRSEERKTLIEKLDQEISELESKWEEISQQIKKSLDPVIHSNTQPHPPKATSPGTSIIGG